VWRRLGLFWEFYSFEKMYRVLLGEYIEVFGSFDEM